MIQHGINKGTNEILQEGTLQDLKHIQGLLLGNFKDYEHYKEMYPKCKQLVRICGLSETDKFNNINEIIINDLKLRPIIDQTNTYTYHAAKAILGYLKSLRNNVRLKTHQYLLPKSDLCHH